MAIKFVRCVVNIFESSFGADEPRVANALNNLALLLKATNRLPEAETLMCRAVTITLQFKLSTGHENPKHQQFIANYRSILVGLKKSKSEIDQIIADLLK